MQFYGFFKLTLPKSRDDRNEQIFKSLFYQDDIITIPFPSKACFFYAKESSSDHALM